MEVRRAGVLSQIDVGVSGNWPEEVIAYRGLLADGAVQQLAIWRRQRIQILREKLREIRNSVLRRRHFKVSAKSTDIREVENCRESEIVLNSEVSANR